MMNKKNICTETAEIPKTNREYIICQCKKRVKKFYIDLYSNKKAYIKYICDCGKTIVPKGKKVLLENF